MTAEELKPEERGHHGGSAPPRGRYLFELSLGALGIVYGDIGTSPLYALRECFHGPHAMALTPANVLGILSLVVWSLIIVISIKYLIFVMRADNRGEGGILALMSLISHPSGKARGRRTILIALGIFGSALLYGDGMITPAISVLSAIEGLQVATPLFADYVVPITVVVLIALFMVQKHGTGGIGKVFGPLTLVWFVCIAALGVMQILLEPHVLVSINPIHAFQFFTLNKVGGFLALGGVFLVVTGGEALYADMGHFGRRPIRLVWFILVLPALLLNYLGQGALLLRNPAAAANPFFFMVPSWALYPMVILATAATCIASQAVISGAFSLTRQATQLGYSPRVRIAHTSATEIGQIYIPAVNWLLMFAAIGLVIGFKTSSALASAYGIAVTATMGLTTILLYVVSRELWKWKLVPALALGAFFLVIDLAFFGANIIKVHDGGWFPLLVGAIIFTLMTTWRRGREILNDRLRKDTLPIDLFLKSVSSSPPHRVKGTAVFMFRNTDGTPPALLHNIKHNKVIHEKVVFLTVVTEDSPKMGSEEVRTDVEPLGHGFFRVLVHYGFMEDPDIPLILSEIKHDDLDFSPSQTSYFLGRETLIATKNPGMAIWRERLFGWMSKNATSATLFYRLPPNRVVELGAQIEL